MRGEVVVVPFPFSDLSAVKHRPALTLIDLPGPDVVLVPIASRGNSQNAISLVGADFQTGTLNHDSFIHPTKLVTVERSQIRKVVGRITPNKLAEVVERIVALISQ